MQQLKLQDGEAELNMKVTVQVFATVCSKARNHCVRSLLSWWAGYTWSEQELAENASEGGKQSYGNSSM